MQFFRRVSRWAFPHHEERTTMIRACEGHVPCTPEGTRPAEKFYLVQGFRTDMQRPVKVPLCDLCPQTLRDEGHQVTEYEPGEA